MNKTLTPLTQQVEALVTANTGQTIDELMHPTVKPVGGMTELVDAFRRIKSIGKKVKITLFGDYDADGITSTTITHSVIGEFLGYYPDVRFPRRYTEGYGISIRMVDEVDEGVILTIDNGIVANEPIAAAKSKGLSVYIMDHHMPRGSLPGADVIVDPHATGDEYTSYCAAGLAYRFAMELCPQSPHESQWVALAAIGTVADMVPLIGHNRTIVRRGLNALNHAEGTMGLNALVTMACGGHLDEEDIGYRVGPVFNAAGRMLDDGARMVFDVVSVHRELYDWDYDSVMADVTARCKELIRNNEERKALVEYAMPHAHAAVKATMKDGDGAIVIRMDIGDDRSTGIMGIVAGNVKEENNLPAFVFAVPQGGDGSVLKGSARTYGDVHIEKLLKAIDKECHLLLGFGGHAGAAGMSIKAEDLDAFRQAVIDRVPQRAADAVIEQKCDITVTDDDVPSCTEAIAAFGPYGMGNPPIRVRVTNVNLTPVNGKYANIVGQKGITFKISGKTFDGVSFEGADMMEEYVRMGSPMALDAEGFLKWHYFRGTRTPQLMVEKILPPSQAPKQHTDADPLFTAALVAAASGTTPTPPPTPNIPSAEKSGAGDGCIINVKKEEKFMDANEFMTLLSSI